MAKKKTETPALDPNKIYKVKLIKAVKVGQTMLRPSEGVRLKGHVIESIKDCIESWEEVATLSA